MGNKVGFLTNEIVLYIPVEDTIILPFTTLLLTKTPIALLFSIKISETLAFTKISPLFLRIVSQQALAIDLPPPFG